MVWYRGMFLYSKCWLTESLNELPTWVYKQWLGLYIHQHFKTSEGETVAPQSIHARYNWDFVITCGCAAGVVMLPPRETVSVYAGHLANLGFLYPWVRYPSRRLQLLADRL